MSHDIERTSIQSFRRDGIEYLFEQVLFDDGSVHYSLSHWRPDNNGEYNILVKLVSYDTKETAEAEFNRWK